MTPGRNRLDQIVRGLDGVTADHERIWLQNDNDAHGCEGRLWCQDKVWPEDDEQGEPTEYVRADLFREMTARNDELLAIANTAEARATAAEATVTALQEALAKAAEALEQIADHTARCEHDGGFDREIGPIGCNLGDKCLCIGLHPIARAALSQIRSEK